MILFYITNISLFFYKFSQFKLFDSSRIENCIILGTERVDAVLTILLYFF